MGAMTSGHAATPPVDATVRLPVSPYERRSVYR